MKLLATVIFLFLLLLAVLHKAPATIPSPDDASGAAVIYDPNPNHVWNRLYEALIVRRDQTGARYGVDALDPLFWLNTEHLLAGSSHRNALSVLDEFLRDHAENQIRDPAKRALLQRVLWAVFDWSARGDNRTAERRELQIRLARVMRRLALTREEIKSLPDNYAQAIASGAFAREYDSGNRDRAFLPPDLLQPRGPWVCIKADLEPVAKDHIIAASGRSRFLVFVRLPQGRKATLNYFQALWNVREPWTKSEIDVGQVDLNPDLPQFPVGTQVALLRQMMVFDHDGTLVPAPITESLQIRVYRAITSRHDHNNVTVDWPAARTEQDFYEIRFSQAQFFAGQAGGLRAIGRSETEFPLFHTHEVDFFELAAKQHIPPAPGGPILDSCAACHSAAGINSVQSRRQLLKPNRAQLDPDPPYDSIWWETELSADWKARLYDWGLLNGYWRANGGSD
jgi:hypothetical protein